MPGDVLKCHFPWRAYLTDQEGMNTLKNTPLKQRNSQDIIKIYYPHDDLFGKMLKEGKLSLWNPYNFCGHPLLAEGRTAVLYPLKMLIYSFFSTGKAYTLLIIVNHILMGTGMVLFLKDMHLSNLSSLAGALIWMYNGYIDLNLEFSTHVQSGVYFAFNILLINRFVRKPHNKLNYLLMIFSLSMTILSGHLQYMFYVILFSFLYFLFQIISSETVKNKKNILKITIMFFLACFIAFATASGQIIPSLELASLSQRPLTGKLINHNYITPLNLATLIYPCATGDTSGNFYFSPEQSGVHTNVETSMFIGIINFHFLILAFILPGWKKEKIFLSIFLIIPLMVLFKIPPFTLIFSLPLFSSLTPFRLVYLFHFAAAIMIATGIEGLIKNNKTKKINIVIITMMIIYLINLVCLFYIFSYISNNIEHIMVSYMKTHGVYKGDVNFVINRILENYNIGNIFFLLPMLTWCISLILFYCFNNSNSKKRILFLYIIILISTCELFIYGFNAQCTLPEKNLYFKTEVTDFLIKNSNYQRVSSFNYESDLPPSDTLMPYSIMDTAGYASLYPGRYFKFMETLNNEYLVYIDPKITRPANYSRGIEQILAIKYYLNQKGTLFPLKKKYPNDYRKVFDSENIELIENLKALPFIFTVGKYRIIKKEEEILEFLKSDTFKPVEEMILETTIKEIKEGEGKSKRNDIVRITEFIPGKIKLEISSEDSDNYLLFVSDNYYPGWKAIVDGKEMPVYRANYIFKAIPINSSGKKKHNIILYFFPELYRVTIITTFVLLSVIIIFILFFLIKR